MLVQIDYKLQFAAPFHAGTGITEGLIDRSVVRDADGNLYIPASTFKGVLREHCEQLCRFYLPNEPIASPHDKRAALTQFGKAPSLISRVFGSPLHPGGLRFNDARQEVGTRQAYQELQTTIATQVRIDRLTRTAVDKALYTSEFGSPYLLFKGTIKGQLNDTPITELTATIAARAPYTLAPTCSLLILLAGMLMVERLGGNKSTGKGQCRCTIENLLLDGRRCTEERWQSWIEHLDVAADHLSGARGGQA